MLQQQLGAAEPSRLIERVYSPEMNRETIAALAQTVFTAARHDAVAASVVDAAARDLAEMVATLAMRLAFAPQGFTLGLAGGLLTQQADLRARLAECLNATGVQPLLTSLVAEPVFGAVRLAQRAAATR
jgi:N-acetylglucosamine kinase-like BadF-type ATPase